MVLSRGRVLRSAAMIFAVVAGGLVVNTQSAAAAAYDGTDPAATGCANTARTIDARNLNGGNARIELRYSRLRSRDRRTACAACRVTIAADRADRRKRQGRRLHLQTPAGTNPTTRPARSASRTRRTSRMLVSRDYLRRGTNRPSLSAVAHSPRSRCASPPSRLVSRLTPPRVMVERNNGLTGCWGGDRLFCPGVPPCLTSRC